MILVTSYAGRQVLPEVATLAQAVGSQLQALVTVCMLASPQALFHDLREVGKGPRTIANERRPVHRCQGSGLERRQPLQRRLCVGCIRHIVRKRAISVIWVIAFSSRFFY
jgi:hypothetical protein